MTTNRKNKQIRLYFRSSYFLIPHVDRIDIATGSFALPPPPRLAAIKGALMVYVK